MIQWPTEKEIDQEKRLITEKKIGEQRKDVIYILYQKKRGLIRKKIIFFFEGL